MKKGTGLWAASLFALSLGAGGCSNTVRYMTTMTWLNVPGGGAAPAAPAGAAPGAAPSSGGDSQRAFYVTFWEGTCSSGLFGFGKGCSVGDSKIRRCNAKQDNSMECVDEAEANVAFARKK